MSTRIKTFLAYGAAVLLAAGNSTASAQSALGLAGGPAPAAKPIPTTAGTQRETVTIPRGMAAEIEFPFPIRVGGATDETIADVAMITPTHATIMGKKAGQTDIRFLDASGKVQLIENVRVEQDFADLGSAIEALVPTARISYRALGDRLIISGTTESNSDRDRVVQLASSMVASPDKLMNFVTSQSNDQVTLQVEVVELNRSEIKQLGFNTNAIFGQLGMDQWGIGNTPTYGVNGGFQGGFSGGYSRDTTSQPVGTSAASLFANLVNIPFGTTGITNSTIGQFVNSFLTGGALTSPQSQWVSTYLNQYAGQVQVVDAVTSQTYTMADVGVNASNLPALVQAYQNGSSTLSPMGNEWMRKFLSSLPNSTNPFYTNTANPASTFIDRNNPANPVATGRAGSAGTNSAHALLQAFERQGLSKTLESPNLTSISGEPATFLVGGEFPAPTGRDQQGNTTIEFKQFGVGLGFTPIVQSNGRITLKINTEASALSSQGALPLAGIAGAGTSTTIPALSVRRMSDTVDLPDGGSIMLAGLLQDDVRENIDKVPGIDQIPIMGALARSRDFLSNQTELVIIATVHLVRPTSRDRLQTPVDGLRIASDMNTILMGKLNTAYKAPPAAVEGRTYEGPFGNVID